MIALQTRGAKLPDPAAQTAKFVSMMNMTKQQEAAERQAALAQQQMGINLDREKRDKQTQTATMRDKDAEFQDKELKRLGRVGVAVLRTEDPTLREAAYQTLLGEVEKADPRLGATMRQVAPTFNAAVVESAVMEVDKYFNAKYPNATYSNEIADAGGFDAQGRPIPAGTLLQVRNSVVPEVAPIPSATAARTSTPVPTAAPQQTTPSPVPKGKFSEDRVIPDNAVPLTDFEQEDIRRIKEGSGMTNTPASFTPGSMGTPTAGRMSPDMVPAILDSAVKTGVMAQIDLDQMLAMTPPQARDGIMQVIRDSKIALQADAPSLAASGMGQQPMAPNPVQRPQSQFADMRGPAPQASFADLGGQPQMQNTMAQYQPVQRRDPNVSPAPGVYGVPTGQVAATSQAQRPSKQEVYDTELAKIRAARDAGPAPVTAQQKIARKSEVAQAYSKAQTLIDKAYNPKEGIISIANKIKSLSDDQKEAITGYSGYVPSFRESSREADTLFGNLKGVVTSLGKDAAAASGAVGNMAVQEWKIAADMIANLDLANMTPRALDAQMDRIIEQVSNATNLAERVYDIQYGDDVKQYPAFKLRGTPPARTKTPVVKGGTRLSPDIDKILKSRGI